MIKWIYIGTVVLAYSNVVGIMLGTKRHMKEKGYSEESKMGYAERIALAIQVIVFGLIPVLNFGYIMLKQKDFNDKLDKKFSRS